MALHKIDVGWDLFHIKNDAAPFQRLSAGVGNVLAPSFSFFLLLFFFFFPFFLPFLFLAFSFIFSAYYFETVI